MTDNNFDEVLQNSDQRKIDLDLGIDEKRADFKKQNTSKNKLKKKKTNFLEDILLPPEEQPQKPNKKTKAITKTNVNVYKIKNMNS